MGKFCQSCGMPLTTANQGTQKDGTAAQQYCHLCYQAGEWTEPTATFEQMLAKGIAGIQADSSTCRFNLWFLVKSYPMMLKKVSRWQAK